MLIRELRIKNKLSQADLASALGLKYQSVQKWEKGTNKPTIDQLPKLAHVLGVDITQLLRAHQGVQDTMNEKESRYVTGNIRSVKVNISEHYIQVPFLSAKAQAGNPTMIFDNCVLHTDETYPVYLPGYTITKKHLVIEIVGESMEPEIRDGAIVLAEQVQTEDIRYQSGGVFAVLFANRFVVKRIKTNEININGTLTLYSDNERYGNIFINANEISCMWRVTEKVREPVR